MAHAAMVRTRALYNADTNKWYVNVDGQEHIMTEQDAVGHSQLRRHRDINAWISVVLCVSGELGYPMHMARFVKYGPQFTHNCDRCEYWGIWFDVDIWFCRDSMTAACGGSILARYGDQASDYYAMDISILLDQMTGRYGAVLDSDSNPPKNRPWLMSGNAPNHYKAWIIALAVYGIKALGGE